MVNSEVSLLQQLSANSDPYRDPLAALDWRSLSLEHYWLPPEALSLHGLAAFNALSEAAKIRLSQYEMLGHAQAGVALERIFLELTASRLGEARESAEYAYLLHEMREEAGHSLMFLKLGAASGLAMPDWRAALPRIARPASRALLNGPVYWGMLVIGEDIPDLNIEGATVAGERLLLFQRGNGRGAVNAVVALHLDAVLAGVGEGRLDADAVIETRRHDLGEVKGVRLCFSDATALEDGRVLFTAVAESGEDTYLDGDCAGAGVGVLDLDGEPAGWEPLDPAYKVEGIEVHARDEGVVILLVADDDDPGSPSPLLEAPLTL